MMKENYYWIFLGVAVGILIYLAVFVAAYRADSSDLDLFEDVSKQNRK